MIMDEIMKTFVTNDIAREKDSYAFEFLRIRVECEDMKVLPGFSCDVGAAPENVPKNRYKDILPFDYSRVPLSVADKDGEGPGSDYINASFINGANGKVAYISAQGPLSETVEDFWRMIVDYNINMIVMLCNTVELGKKKCEQYWPDKGESKYLGFVQVSLLNEEHVAPDLIVRYMRVAIPTVTEELELQPPVFRDVRQIHYSGWPDHGVPDNVQSLIDLIELMRRYQPVDRDPLLIHCSAGCGRSGTIIGIDYVRTLLKNCRLTKDFNVLDLVLEMRKQRPAMVQTPEQYMLIHRVIREMFKQHLDMIEEHIYENVSPQLAKKPKNVPSDIQATEANGSYKKSKPPVPPRRSKALLKRAVTLQENRQTLGQQTDITSVPSCAVEMQEEKNHDKATNVSTAVSGRLYTTDKTKWVTNGGVSVPDFPYWPLEKPGGPQEMPVSFDEKL